MPSSNSSQAIPGNVGVPEWMLKRRARQQAQADSAVVEDAIESHTDVQPTSAIIKSTAPVAEVDSETPASNFPDFEVPRRSLPDPIILDAVVGVAVRDSSKPASVPVRIPIKAAPVQVRPTLPWYEEIQLRWLGRKEQKSFLISLAIHLACAASLSLVVFHQDLSNGLNTLLAVQDDDAGAEALDDSEIFKIDTSGGMSGETLDSILTASAVTTSVGPSFLTVPEDLGGMKLGEGEGTGDEVGNGVNVGGFKMPEGGKVVKKGSFTAWTVPQDPKPGEDYKIIIQVKYKQKSQKLPPGDITGSVIGTDKYRLMISQHTAQIISEANQVVVEIPGAAARVRDTIRVYSAMLKENQRLEIVF